MSEDIKNKKKGFMDNLSRPRAVTFGALWGMLGAFSLWGVGYLAINPNPETNAMAHETGPKNETNVLESSVNNPEKTQISLENKVFPQVQDPKPTQFDNYFAQFGKQYGIDSRLLKIQVNQESKFNPHAVSPAGAIGLAQAMGDTADDYGYSRTDMLDPKKATDFQAHYMRDLLDSRLASQFPNDERTKLSLALAMYNAGRGNVQQAVNIVRSANLGDNTYKRTLHIRGKTVKKEVDITRFRGKPETWETFKSALYLITGNHAKETETYVRNIMKEYMPEKRH